MYPVILIFWLGFPFVTLGENWEIQEVEVIVEIREQKGYQGNGNWYFLFFYFDILVDALGVVNFKILFSVSG